MADADFVGSGLKAPSVVRLGFLTTMPADRFLGVLGSISRDRHLRLLDRLSRFLALDQSSHGRVCSRLGIKGQGIKED